jgi:hypothetical protein
MRVRAGERTSYHITVRNPRGVSSGVARASPDGRPLLDAFVPLDDDGADRVVDVELEPTRESVSAVSQAADPDTIGTLDRSGDR